MNDNISDSSSVAGSSQSIYTETDRISVRLVEAFGRAEAQETGENADVKVLRMARLKAVCALLKQTKPDHRADVRSDPYEEMMLVALAALKHLLPVQAASSDTSAGQARAQTRRLDVLHRVLRVCAGGDEEALSSQDFSPSQTFLPSPSTPMPPPSDKVSGAAPNMTTHASPGLPPDHAVLMTALLSKHRNEWGYAAATAIAEDPALLAAVLAKVTHSASIKARVARAAVQTRRQCPGNGPWRDTGRPNLIALLRAVGFGEHTAQALIPRLPTFKSTHEYEPSFMSQLRASIHGKDASLRKGAIAAGSVSPHVLDPSLAAAPPSEHPTWQAAQTQGGAPGGAKAAAGSKAKWSATGRIKVTGADDDGMLNIEFTPAGGGDTVKVTGVRREDISVRTLPEKGGAGQSSSVDVRTLFDMCTGGGTAQSEVTCRWRHFIDDDGVCRVVLFWDGSDQFKSVLFGHRNTSSLVLGGCCSKNAHCGAGYLEGWDLVLTNTPDNDDMFRVHAKETVENLRRVAKEQEARYQEWKVR